MSNSEMTVAIPASKVASTIAALRATAAADNAVAGYASEDARRFALMA
jgi:hypothetical protein